MAIANSRVCQRVVNVGVLLIVLSAGDTSAGHVPVGISKDFVRVSDVAPLSNKIDQTMMIVLIIDPDSIIQQ